MNKLLTLFEQKLVPTMNKLTRNVWISSPTFALVNEYDARLTVQHFDMYRVSGWDDLYSTGFFDYLDTDNVLVIEWSENIDGALPENTIYVHMEKGETETERS